MELINTYLIAIGGMAFLMVTWVYVQAWWRTTFAEDISDDDVLAERRSCGQCGCISSCQKPLEIEKKLEK